VGLRKNKKAIAMYVVVILIIAAVVAVVLFNAAGRLRDLIEKKADEDTCRFSVMVNSEVKDATKSMLENTPLQCIANLYKAKPSNLKIDDTDSIVTQLDDCWYKMGAGDFKVYGNEILDQAFCIVCSEFTVNNKITEEELIKRLKERNSKYDEDETIHKFLHYEGKLTWNHNIFDESGIRTDAIQKPEDNDDNKNVYLVVYRRFAKGKIKVFEGDSQKLFIVHEGGIGDVTSEGLEGFKCDQLLWEKGTLQ